MAKRKKKPNQKANLIRLVIVDQYGNVITVGLAVYDGDGTYRGTTGPDGALPIRDTPPLTIIINPNGHSEHPPNPNYQQNVQATLNSYTPDPVKVPSV